MRYEYRVVPAPERGEKVKGVKTAEGRFAAALERIMNEMAADGWEYLRSDTLPSEERSGLTSTQTVWRNLLVFRRASVQDAEIFAPRRLEPPAESPPDTPVGPQDDSAGTGPVSRLRAQLGRDADTEDGFDGFVTAAGASLAEPPVANDPQATAPGLPGALRARAARLRAPDGQAEG